jgi:hypothetical protein
MKKKLGKLSGIVAVITVLALLAVVVPATPALAEARIYLDPDEGEIGDRIDIEGLGFSPSTITPPISRYVDIYFSSQEALVNDDIGYEVTNWERVKSTEYVDTVGNFSAHFLIPAILGDGDEDEAVHSGTYYIYVTYAGDDNIEAFEELTVIAAGIALDTDEGPVGTDIEISGSNFVDNEEITVEYDGVEIAIESGDEETDNNGAFDSTVIIPASAAGTHTITVEDESGSLAEAEFTVTPEITGISPDSGSPGDTATVSGTGFADEVTIIIEFGGDEVASDETEDDGSFQVSFAVPVKAPGTYNVEAIDDDNNRDEVEFTIGSGAQVSQTNGNVGSQVTVSGSGFSPNTPMTINYDTTPVAAGTATDDVGRFSATFNVPKSNGGAHLITVSDGVNPAKSFTFNMESNPPPTPQPSLPYQGAKLESEDFFDWEDVTDPSEPVTYSLQIASDANFAGIVLEKPGLTTSAYTLTVPERELMKPSTEEAPYYWRVRAIDAASNASDWTGAGSFYVGSTFSFIGWPLYTVLGLGGLILLALGFWLGRRTAYY